MTNQYAYQPLCQSTRDIRLLRLLPTDSNVKLKNIPACDIFHTSLNKNPKFVALSYVWGDLKNLRMIRLDKNYVRVTANLYDALMAIRTLKGPIVIWIDALCINQSDKIEKNWQVGLMGNIYRQAQKVIAWLGLADDSSDSVMDYLNTFGECAEACGLAVGPDICARLWPAMASDPAAIQQLPEIVAFLPTASNGGIVTKHALQALLHSIDGWHSRDELLPIAALKRLFGRLWWGRIWVLQEIALPRCAEFVCGAKQISRQRFSAAFNAYYALWEVLSSLKRQGRYLGRYHEEVVFTISHRPKLMLSAWRIHESSSFPLLALLRTTSVGSVYTLGREGHQHLESTDPRDKIFALLGLAKDQKDLEQKEIRTDYSKSAEEVYTSVSAALLQQGHISILSLCRFPTTMPGLPSWVCDWSQPMPESLQDVEHDHMTLDPSFSASGVGVRPRTITILKKGGAIEGISVECYVYDKVYETGDVPRVPTTETCLCVLHWLGEILRLTYKCTDASVSFEHRLRAVVRTSFGGIIYGSEKFLERPNDESLDACYLEALYILHKGMGSIRQQDIRAGLKQHCAQKHTRKLIQRMEGKALKRLHMEYMRMSAKTSPFVTEKGHLGLSSRHVERGDTIALIHGAQVPFILRSHVNGKYIIVSEAYVDGIMDGEAAETAIWQKIEFM